MVTRDFKQPLVWVIGYAIFAVILIESIHRGSLLVMMDWVFESPAQALYLLCLFIFGFGTLFVFKRRGFFIIASLFIFLFSLLAFSSYTKERLRGDPLLPIDLLMVGEARNMLQFFSDLSWWIWLICAMIVVLVVGLFTAVIKKIGKEERSKWHFILPALSLACFCFLLSIGTSHPVSEKENYNRNGVLAGFFSNISVLKVEPPEHYSEDSFDALLDEWQTLRPESDRKPHIIMVMSEAFWDPAVLDKVKFNQDPLPNYRKLSENFSSGTLHVPVYGGSTANTEFEVLAGMSHLFLPPGAIAYKSYVKKPLPALPYLLKSHGYETTAYHTYHNWFYERNKAYRWLGFDHFVSLEFFPNPVQDMMYYRDNEITDEILKKINGSEQPQFIYAITMQNHGPYRNDAKKFYATMDAEGNLTADSKHILEFYADNLVEIDKELQRLVMKLQEMGEDAIVVFFGDHLPLLGDDYAVYKEAGYFSGDKTFDEYMKMYSTPLLVWDAKESARENLQMSSSFLGAYLLEKAGLSGYYLTDFMNELRNSGKALLLRDDYKKNSDLTEDERKTLELLQYDLLSGNRQGMKLAGVRLPQNNNYRLGLSDPRIDTVERSEYKGREALLLKGGYFTAGSQIYLNGEAVEYSFINEREMIAFVSDPAEVKTVQIKIFDSENRKLAESKVAVVEGRL